MLRKLGQFTAKIRGMANEFRASFDPAVKLVWQTDGKSFELHQGGGVFVAKRKP